MKEIVSSNSGVAVHHEEEKGLVSLKDLPRVYYLFN